MPKKSADITEKQAKFLEENHINFSSWVREELRKEMEEHRFEEKRKKSDEKQRCDTEGCKMPAYTKQDVEGYTVDVCVRCDEKGREFVEQKIREGDLEPYGE